MIHTRKKRAFHKTYLNMLPNYLYLSCINFLVLSCSWPYQIVSWNSSLSYHWILRACIEVLLSVTKAQLCSKNRTGKRALNSIAYIWPPDELPETKGDKCHSYVKSRGVDTDMCCFPVTQKSWESFYGIQVLNLTFAEHKIHAVARCIPNLNHNANKGPL